MHAFVRILIKRESNWYNQVRVNQAGWSYKTDESRGRDRRGDPTLPREDLGVCRVGTTVRPMQGYKGAGWDCAVE